MGRGNDGDALKVYHDKRDFSRTAEPRGRVTRSTSGRSYVIQKHDASHLHYDFRLEHDGVLKSWAVPKGVGLKPGDKRLAVMTEDHPLDYAGFEGVITEGEYGGGTVMLWDRGTWEPLDDPDVGFRKGKITFRLHGAKLEGTWTLVRMRPRAGERGSQWLLIKDANDAVPRTPDELSVETGRDLPAIAAARNIYRAGGSGSAPSAAKSAAREGTRAAKSTTREGTRAAKSTTHKATRAAKSTAHKATRAANTSAREGTRAAKATARKATHAAKTSARDADARAANAPHRSTKAETPKAIVRGAKEVPDRATKAQAAKTKSRPVKAVASQTRARGAKKSPVRATEAKASKAATRTAKAATKDSTSRAAKPRAARSHARAPAMHAKGITRARRPSRDADADASEAIFPAQDDALVGAVPAPFPSTVSPTLCTLVDHVPSGDLWRHERKYDGYRIFAQSSGDGSVTLLTRRGLDWTARVPALTAALAPLGDVPAIIDGELVCLSEKGQSDFQKLQNSLSHGKTCTLRYYAFDILYLGGYDIRPVPLRDRRRLLEALFARLGWDGEGVCALSPELGGDGESAFADACRNGWEGVISKRADAPYPGRRSWDWVKTKCQQRQELVIVGYTKPKGRRQHLGALALGYYEGKALRYAGHVGTGFDEDSLRDLAEALAPLERPTSPLSESFKDPLRRTMHWVEPRLVAEVEFTGWTSDGRLRHPSFKGLRDDKPARSVVREETRATPPAASGSRPPDDVPPENNPDDDADDDTDKAPTASRAKGTASAKTRSAQKPTTAKSSPKAGKHPARTGESPVALTHPERVLYPDVGVTKADLAQYLWDVAPYMLPHVKDRPLAIVRCPDGRGKACFFQKHVSDGLPPAIGSAAIPEKGGTLPTLVVHDAEGLASMAQIGCLEIHPWACLATAPEAADRLVFDLDPAPAVPWPAVVKTARAIRDRLAAWGLVSFVKTSGVKGLHVVSPLTPAVPWDDLKDFARAIVASLWEEDPGLYTLETRKAKRGDRIYLDDLRNSRGATHVAPYSTRARPDCPISTPLAWDELTARVKPDAFHFGNIRSRLDAVARHDPWSAFFTTRQSLPPRPEWETSGPGLKRASRKS